MHFVPWLTPTLPLCKKTPLSLQTHCFGGWASWLNWHVRLGESFSISEEKNTVNRRWSQISANHMLSAHPLPFLIVLTTALLTSQTLGVRHKSWKLREWFIHRSKMHMAAISFFPTLISMPIPTWKDYSNYSRYSYLLEDIRRHILLTVLPLGISVSLGVSLPCWQAVGSGAKYLHLASNQLLWTASLHCCMYCSVCWCCCMLVLTLICNLFVENTNRQMCMESPLLVYRSN